MDLVGPRVRWKWGGVDWVVWGPETREGGAERKEGWFLLWALALDFAFCFYCASFCLVLVLVWFTLGIWDLGIFAFTVVHACMHENELFHEMKL